MRNFFAETIFPKVDIENNFCRKVFSKVDAMMFIPSRKHPRMAMSDRAAQFSPFQALTGYAAAIKETARFTDQWIELDESSKAELNEKLRFLADQIPNASEAAFTYFVPDQHKDGGEYVNRRGFLKKVDLIEQVIVLTDGCTIQINSITGIEIE